MAGSEIAAAKALIDVVLIAHEEGWLDQLANLLRKRHKVLVLGSTGVGKTQLIKSLTKLIPEAIHYMDRTNFVTRHKLKIDGQLFEFIEAPGDQEKKGERTKAYREALKSGASMIVNVVSYGYHEYRVGDLSKIFDKKNNVLEGFLETHRAEEVNQIKEWNWLLDDDAVKCLLTVIAKADIWWDRQSIVIDHYRRGVYSDEITRYDCGHAVIPYSSRRHKMFNRGTLSNQFDDTDRTDLRALLFQNLFSAVGRARA